MHPGQLVIEVGLFNGCFFFQIRPASDVPYVSDIAPTCISSLCVGSGHGKFAQKLCVRINPDTPDQSVQCFSADRRTFRTSTHISIYNVHILFLI